MAGVRRLNAQLQLSPRTGPRDPVGNTCSIWSSCPSLALGLGPGCAVYWLCDLAKLLALSSHQFFTDVKGHNNSATIIESQRD